MFKRIGTTALLCCALAPLAGQAADKDGRFAVKGLGRATCTQFLDNANKPQESMLALQLWLDGYLTALNQGLPETYDVASWVSTPLLAKNIADFCASKPSPDPELVALANELVRRLAPERLQTESPLVDIKVGDKQGKIYKDTLRRAQQALKDKGHYRGAADGLFGPQTRSAFEAFQKAEQLQVTGVPDQPTLIKLLQPAGG